MYEAVIEAITKRANRSNWAYVEDYGSSIHKTARISMDDAVDTINILERLGWAEVTRTTNNFPVAVKLLVKPQECKEYVASARYSLINVLNQATTTNTDVEVSQ